MWSNLVSNPRRGTFVLGLFILTLGVGALALPSLGRMDLRGVSILDIELMRTSENAAQQVALLGSSTPPRCRSTWTSRSSSSTPSRSARRAPSWRLAPLSAVRRRWLRPDG
jgi:hypothetical protein